MSRYWSLTAKENGKPFEASRIASTMRSPCSTLPMWLFAISKMNSGLFDRSFIGVETPWDIENGSTPQYVRWLHPARPTDAIPAPHGRGRCWERSELWERRGPGWLQSRLGWRGFELGRGWRLGRRRERGRRC